MPELPAERPPSRSFLEGLYRRHHRLELLHPDPLVFARGFPDPADGEVAGLVAAAFAYGRVEGIMATLGRIFGVLGPRPRAALERTSVAELRAAFEGFSHRFQKTADLVLFLWLARGVLERRGSLAEAFRRGDPGGPVGPALSAFAEELLAGDARPALRGRTVPAGHPVRHLIASPARGGAAKRLCLFLRWMARRDALDPGYWQGLVDPSRLVIPLDTHVARVARELGFTARRTADWKTACEVTERLRGYDPADPVRYDFSLFRTGLSGSVARR